MDTNVCIPLAEVTDDVLMQQALAGNKEAFETLVRRYQAPLFRLTYNILGNYHLAHDVLQHVFLQLYVSLHKIQADKSLKAWLFQVARHRCFDELRRTRLTYFSELESANYEEEEPAYATIPDPGLLVEEIVEKHEVQEQIQHAIEGLPQKYRTVVWLRYTAQLNFSQIGQQLHISEATVKTHFYRARPLLRKALSEAHMCGMHAQAVSCPSNR